MGSACQVAISSVNYKTFLLEFFYPSDSKTTSIDYGNIFLSTQAGSLKEVVVEGVIKKPLITQEVDRIVYNAQADPGNAATSALDMLRKVPLISIDAAGAIKLKGSGDYKILLNGKSSSMVAKNVSDIFKAMPANNIEKIEVFTSPPAKYDGEGLVGIINIITKKNAANGSNGSVTAGYHSFKGPQVNFKGGFQEDKFAATGFMGFSTRNETTTESGYSSNITSPIALNISQSTTNKMSGKDLYGNFDMSYEADSLNLFSATLNLYHYKTTPSNLQTATILDGNNVLTQSFLLSNEQQWLFKGMDAGFDYQHSFKNHKNTQVTSSYKYSTVDNIQDITTNYLKRYKFNSPDYQQNNTDGMKEHTVQFDLSYPVKKLSLESGVKGIFRNNFSQFTSTYFDSNTNKYLVDPAQTNNFKYQQNILSAYQSLQFSLVKWVGKAGLRFEYTGITPSLSTGSSVYSQSHYSNLLPSVSIQRNLSPASNISLDYSERIKRPGIWQINPFVDRSNPLFIKIGNPALQPIVMHVIDINYNYYKKASLTANLSYSSSNNSFEEVAQIKTDSTTVFTYLNTSLLQQLDLSLSGSFPISPKFTISYNHLFTYVKLAGNVNSKKITNSGFQGDFYASVRYNLAKGFNMSLDGGGETRYILLQGKDNYYPYVSLSAAKEVFNKKGMITFLLQNPFTKLLKVDFYTNGPGFSQYSYNNFYHRAIAIKFRYSFGKSRTSIKKANQQIINDDIKQKSK